MDHGNSLKRVRLDFRNIIQNMYSYELKAQASKGLKNLKKMPYLRQFGPPPLEFLAAFSVQHSLLRTKTRDDYFEEFQFFDSDSYESCEARINLNVKKSLSLISLIPFIRPTVFPFFTLPFFLLRPTRPSANRHLVFEIFFPESMINASEYRAEYEECVFPVTSSYCTFYEMAVVEVRRQKDNKEQINSIRLVGYFSGEPNIYHLRAWVEECEQSNLIKSLMNVNGDCNLPKGPYFSITTIDNVWHLANAFVHNDTGFPALFSQIPERVLSNQRLFS